jgi:hypothetical protein
VPLFSFACICCPAPTKALDEEEARFYNDLHDAAARREEQRKREESAALAAFKESIANQAKARAGAEGSSSASSAASVATQSLRIGSVDKSLSYSETSKLQTKGGFTAFSLLIPSFHQHRCEYLQCSDHN